MRVWASNCGTDACLASWESAMCLRRCGGKAGGGDAGGAGAIEVTRTPIWRCARAHTKHTVVPAVQRQRRRRCRRHWTRWWAPARQERPNVGPVEQGKIVSTWCVRRSGEAGGDADVAGRGGGQHPRVGAAQSQPAAGAGGPRPEALQGSTLLQHLLDSVKHTAIQTAMSALGKWSSGAYCLQKRIPPGL